MKIRTRKIGELGGEGQYIVREYDDFEYVNPIHQIMVMYIGTMMSFERDLSIMNGFSAPEDIMEKILFKRALKDWNKEYRKYKAIDLPKNLLGLLKIDKKKEQIRLLQGLSLTSHELIAFIFKAYEDYGYLFSQYHASHHHKGLDESVLPEVIHIDKTSKVHSVGQTTLTEGQLRQVIEQRKVIVSKFLDKDSKWHCFFLTYKSLGGKEQYKEGKPHLHYISNAWNIPRNVVKEQLTSKMYHLPSLPHIDFHTHRNPRQKKQ